MTTTSRARAEARYDVIDIHAHALPSDWLEALLEDDGRTGSAVLGADGRIRLGDRLTPAVPPLLHDLRARLQEMDRTGVDLQVVSPWMEVNPTGMAPVEAAAFLRRLNDAMSDLTEQQPNRLRALALVGRRDPRSAAEELVRSARLPGIIGVELAAGGGPALHEPEWDTFWASANEQRAFVLLHPWLARTLTEPAPPGLGDIVDNPAQSTAVVAAMVLTGVFDRFPDLRVCVVHGGGSLPYQAGRFDAIAPLHSGRDELRTRPSEVLRRLLYDSLTHSPASLRWLIEFAGPERVLLGSDYPFPTGDRGAAAAVRALGGPADATRRLVLGGNARALIPTHEVDTKSHVN